MSDPVLDIENLHVYFDVYEGTSEVVNGVDLAIEEGETAALVGETGCGKSVTSKSVLGLLPNSAFVPEGEVRLKGQDITHLSDREMTRKRGREVSMILQDPMTALNPVFTVGEQMLDILKWQGEYRLSITEWVRDKFRDHDGMKERAIDMLERVQISAPERVFSSYPVELSGGMRQRVVIAMALLSEPDLLIADEPTTALDVTTQSRILDLIQELIDNSGTSVLYITHDLSVARQISDSVNVMYAGEIVESAPTSDLFENPQHPYTRELMDSIPQLDRGIGKGIPGELPDYTDPPKACRFAERCPFATEDCREVFPYTREVEDEHHVACHLYEGPVTFDRHTQLVDQPVEIGKAPWQETPTVRENTQDQQ